MTRDEELAAFDLIAGFLWPRAMEGDERALRAMQQVIERVATLLGVNLGG